VARGVEARPDDESPPVPAAEGASADISFLHLFVPPERPHTAAESLWSTASPAASSQVSCTNLVGLHLIFGLPRIRAAHGAALVRPALRRTGLEQPRRRGNRSSA
jgi:hypothetical protein